MCTHTVALSEKRYGMVQAGSLGARRTERGRCLLWAVEETESHLLLKCTETQRWREELLNTEEPHFSEALEIRKIPPKMSLKREI
jgi:hypothetical protein